jgi:FKBP-type peptidyl-prolyl cis-trans isomerase FkpA
MKPLNLLITAAILGTTALSAADYAPKTENEKIFYSLGYANGQNYKTLGMSDGEVKALTQAITDAVTGKTAKVDVDTYVQKIQGLAQERMMASAAEEKKRGEAFAADYLKKHPKAKKTESGLIYEVVKAGSGKAPAATDTVEVHYVGTLTDGTEFDSSRKRGQTAKFPLNGVIKGWTEGLQLVQPGGTIKLVIPSDLAYGDRGNQKIPGGSTLVFDVELLKVNP